MTDSLPSLSPRESENLSWLLAQWTTGLSDSLSDPAKTTPVINLVESGFDEMTDCQWWQFALFKKPAVWIGASLPSWKTLARRQQDNEEADEAQIQAHSRSFAQKTLEGIAEGLAARCGEEVICGGGDLLASLPAPESLDVGRARAGDRHLEHQRRRRHFVRGLASIQWDTHEPAELCFAVTLDLLQRMDRRSKSKAAQEAKIARPSSMPFHSVMDVEFEICVSLGCARLKLSEMLALRDGSLVPLGKGLTEPVDLIVNGRIMARGELIVVDGQFGVRISELVNDNKRFQQLSVPAASLFKEAAAS